MATATTLGGLDELQAEIRGDVIAPDDARYVLDDYIVTEATSLEEETPAAQPTGSTVVIVAPDTTGSLGASLRAEIESIVRATNVASAPSASETGLNGWSETPNGVDFVIFPSSDVGDAWPLVRP